MLFYVFSYEIDPPDYEYHYKATNYMEIILLLSNTISKIDKNIINKIAITNFSDMDFETSILLKLFIDCCLYYKKQYTNLEFTFWFEKGNENNEIGDMVRKTFFMYKNIYKLNNDFKHLDNLFNMGSIEFMKSKLTNCFDLLLSSNKVTYDHYRYKIIDSEFVTIDRATIFGFNYIHRNYNNTYKNNGIDELYIDDKRGKVVNLHKRYYLHIIDTNYMNENLINNNQYTKLCVPFLNLKRE